MLTIIASLVFIVSSIFVAVVLWVLFLYILKIDVNLKFTLWDVCFIVILYSAWFYSSVFLFGL
jgi:hypothetical protein